MFSKKYILILLIIILLIVGFVIFSNSTSKDKPQIKNTEVIANNTTQDLGSVEVIRNIGNPNAKKIAYVVGENYMIPPYLEPFFNTNPI
jgi:hypothetical protein